MKKTTSFLCALLAASMTPRARAAVTTVNTPVAAQRAFQAALNGLDASGWPAAAETISISQPTPQIVAKAAPPKVDPVMTPELMARLIKFLSEVEGNGSVAKQTCHIYDLCDGTADMPVKLAEAETATDGALHYATFPASQLNSDSKDLIIVRKSNTTGALESFLTDKTGKLRAAAVQSNGVARLITNEKAAEQYKKELAIFAREASDLPPTGAAIAGK